MCLTQTNKRANFDLPLDICRLKSLKLHGASPEPLILPGTPLEDSFPDVHYTFML